MCESLIHSDLDEANEKGYENYRNKNSLNKIMRIFGEKKFRKN